MKKADFKRILIALNVFFRYTDKEPSERGG